MGRTIRTGITVILFAVSTVLAFSGEKMKIGYVDVMDEAPVHTAYEAGYYRDRGLDVELIRFSSGTDLAKSLATGRLDVGVLGFTNAITWAAQGADLRIVGGVQQGYHSLIVRKGSGISTVGGLRGKTLASQKQGSTADIVLDGVVLKKAGLSKSDLTIRYVTPAVALQSLVSGSVDAAFLFEPYDRMARYAAPVTEIYEIGREWPFPCMVVITSVGTLEKRRVAVNSVLEAQKDAIGLLESDPGRAANLIAPYFIPSGTVDASGGPVGAEKIVAEAIERNTFAWKLTRTDIARMKEIAGMMLDTGILTKKIDIESVLDLSWQKNME